jgi:hypothetical protein
MNLYQHQLANSWIKSKSVCKHLARTRYAPLFGIERQVFTGNVGVSAARH